MLTTLKKRFIFLIANDDLGLVISTELILISTIALIGLIAGFTSVRDGVVSELSDVAGSVQDLNQSYRFNGVVGHSASTAGSNFQDALDFCDDVDDVSGQADNCIIFNVGSDDELTRFVVIPSLSVPSGSFVPFGLVGP